MAAPVRVNEDNYVALQKEAAEQRRSVVAQLNTILDERYGRGTVGVASIPSVFVREPDANAGQFTPITPKKNTAEATPRPSLVVAAPPKGEELPCCAGRAPCKHWAYDGNTMTWKNILSGRVREAES